MSEDAIQLLKRMIDKGWAEPDAYDGSTNCHYCGEPGQGVRPMIHGEKCAFVEAEAFLKNREEK